MSRLSISQIPLANSLETLVRDGAQKAAQEIYWTMGQIQSLNIQASIFLPSFRSRIDGKLVTTPFLVNSLKRLFVDVWNEEASNLNAKNACWILAFCTGLEQASIGVSFSQDDFKFLEDHSEALHGVSNVDQLALNFQFVFESTDRKTWWGLPSSKIYDDNQKTEAVMRFLSLTKNLKSLELQQFPRKANPDDNGVMHFNCISRLFSSFSTLRHLRLFTIGNYGDDTISFFVNLKILTLDLLGWQSVVRLHNQKIQLPPKVKVLILPFYALDPRLYQGRGDASFLEERALAALIKERAFQSLKEVLIPSRMISIYAQMVDLNELSNLWKEGRNLLEKEIFSRRKSWLPTGPWDWGNLRSEKVSRSLFEQVDLGFALDLWLYLIKIFRSSPSSRYQMCRTTRDSLPLCLGFLHSKSSSKALTSFLLL